MTKVLVCGSRDFEVTIDKMYQDLNDALMLLDLIGRGDNNPIEIVSGGARGPDDVAIEMARKYELKYNVFYADWNKYGKSAGPIRNKEMVDYTDIMLAYWDGSSPGTKSTIDFMKGTDKLSWIFYPEGYFEDTNH